jgi:hypothetical protein
MGMKFGLSLLREDHGLRVSKNREQRIAEPKREEDRL